MILALANSSKPLKKLRTTDRRRYDPMEGTLVDSFSNKVSINELPCKILDQMMVNNEIEEWELIDMEGYTVGWFTIFDILHLLREQGKI